MLTVSPQLNITQNFVLNYSQILNLYSSPFTVVPAEPGYAPIFQRAALVFKYGTTPFSNVDDLLSFKTVLSDLTEFYSSNSLNALNILGRSQDLNAQFVPANPYEIPMSSAGNSKLIIKLEGSNPTGGDASASLSISITYGVLRIT